MKKRTALVAAVVLMAVMGTAPRMMAWQSLAGGDPHAEAQNPSGDLHAGRSEFGASCGIQDTSEKSAEGFVMSANGEWSTLDAGSGPSGSDHVVARVWRAANWMVDVHGALQAGMAAMHSGQMCFDPQGHIKFMDDRFMEMLACGCMRVTSMTFGPDGRAMRRETHFIKMATGEEIAAPAVAADFPDVWDVRKLEQLPFSPLLKR